MKHLNLSSNVNILSVFLYLFGMSQSAIAAQIKSSPVNLTVTPQQVISGSPVIYYTDILSGPNSGGENNKGIFLSLFGKNFGNGGLGTTTKVYINNIEIDNYRSLGISRARPDIQQLTVQIGSLGNSMTGVPLPIKVVVNGTSSNLDQTFVINPGNIYFVDPINGVDTADTTTGGTFSSPFKTMQKPGIGLTFSIQSASTSGAYGRLRAGDFVILRGGVYNTIGFGGTAGTPEGYFMQALNKSGCPLGSKCAQGGGTTSGPITIMGYPGEDAFIDRTNTKGNDQFGGGFSAADSARHSNGYGSWWTITNVRIESGFNDGPINIQKGELNPLGANWRVVNNEMTAKSCAISSLCRAGGIAGNGNGNIWLGNYIHDVYDKSDGNTDLENHGIYIGESGSYEIAYNVIKNIFGGNGIQTNSNGANGITNVHIKYNLINRVGKHGINIADHEDGLIIVNNVVMNSDMSGLRFNSDLLKNAKVFNNTFYNSDLLNTYSAVRSMLQNDGNFTNSAIEIRNNIFYPGSANRLFEGGNVGFGSVKNLMSNNLFFSGTGSITGSNNVITDPKFNSISMGQENLHLQIGSSAIDTGINSVSPFLSNDYDLTKSRPQNGTFDIGAFEN